MQVVREVRFFLPGGRTSVASCQCSERAPQSRGDADPVAKGEKRDGAQLVRLVTACKVSSYESPQECGGGSGLMRAEALVDCARNCLTKCSTCSRCTCRSPYLNGCPSGAIHSQLA